MNYPMNSHKFDYFYGWNYLVSPNFRNRVRSRCSGKRSMKVLCYSAVLTSLLLTSTAAVLALLAIWHLLNG